MSPKPSRITPFPVEASGVAEELVFGEEGRPSLVIPKALIAQIWAQVTEGTACFRAAVGWRWEGYW